MSLTPVIKRSLNGTRVGGHGQTALCDFCNKPLKSGDDVRVLASKDGVKVRASWVVCADEEIDAEPEEDHAVHMAAELSTAVTDPSQLVLARVREIGEPKDSA
ncbi:hypothetical protein [Halobacterium salinarum]|uniref:hypothetical protein n=1 Tax=Halobacterium salinarum TaxID=2242 RepID=UPI001F473D61|nr:hypothetical protein [Halobacterium salinarum]MCF2165435.1 hypothetical protein [Halobacterium salinarum]MCF2168300.1 hypothetical protein [Halobacterium salinarum]